MIDAIEVQLGPFDAALRAYARKQADDQRCVVEFKGRPPRARDRSDRRRLHDRPGPQDHPPGRLPALSEIHRTPREPSPGAAPLRAAGRRGRVGAADAGRPWQGSRPGAPAGTQSAEGACVAADRGDGRPSSPPPPSPPPTAPTPSAALPRTSPHRPRQVATGPRAPAAVIEDASQDARAQLLTRPDITANPECLGWLTVVARRHGMAPRRPRAHSRSRGRLRPPRPPRVRAPGRPRGAAHPEGHRAAGAGAQRRRVFSRRDRARPRPQLRSPPAAGHMTPERPGTGRVPPSSLGAWTETSRRPLNHAQCGGRCTRHRACRS